MGFRPAMVAPLSSLRCLRSPTQSSARGKGCSRADPAVTGVPDPSVSKVSRWPHLPRKSFPPHLVPPARSDAKETEEITN